MNELSDLKDIWQNQPITKRESGRSSDSGLVEEINRYKRKIYLTNLFTSIGMLIVLIYLGTIFYTYPGQKPLFYASILAVMLLIIGVVILLWSRRIKAGNDMMLSSTDYARYQIRKLTRTRQIIEFSPLYGLALGILISLYAYSLMEHASGEFVFWMTNANWIYIIIVSFVSSRYKIKKFRKEAQPIIDQLSAFLEE